MPLGRFGVKFTLHLIKLLFPLVVLLLVLFSIFDNPALHVLLSDAFAQVTWASVLATVPGQIAAILLCTTALHVLRPGVGFAASLSSRLLRDAGGNLLVFMPGLGEIISTRALVLSGGQTRRAITAVAIDSVTEILGQLPYILLALWVVPRFLSAAHMPEIALDGQQISVGIAVVFIAICMAIWALKHQGIWPKIQRRLHLEWRLFRRGMRKNPRGIPLSILLHIAAWSCGGLQFWMAAHALGLSLSLFAALAVESVAYAARAIVFFIPAGLVLQEASLIGAGLVFGLPAPAALALGLVLRLRDALFGMALILWPLLEWQHRIGNGSGSNSRR